MSLPRRRLIAAACASAVLAACQRASAPPRRMGVLDVARLADGFPGLAAEARPGAFNLGVMSLADGRSWSADDSGHYPLAGLAGVLIAAAMLGEVDAGRAKLNERETVGAADLSIPPSLINGRFPSPPTGRSLTLPLADLVALAVQKTDSTAADTLLRRLGGPAAVTAWLEGKGVQGLRLERTERERVCEIFGMGPFQPEWKDAARFDAARHAVPPAARQSAAQRWLGESRDAATAAGVLGFLQRLSAGALLGATSAGFLLRLMTVETGQGADVLSGLPAGAGLARSGAATPTDLGYTAADAEAGIVSFPDGARLAYVAFIAGSTATAQARARLLGDAGRLMASAMRA